MNSPVTRRIYIVMFLALLALLINAAIPINALRLLDHSYEEMADARETVSVIDNVLLSMVDAQTGSRGYVITGNPGFLEPYYNAVTRFDDQLKKLQSLAQRQKTVAQDYNELGQKCAHALQLYEEVITIRQAQGAEAAVARVASGEGKRRMDAIRSSIADLRGLETGKLEQLKTENDKIFRYTTAALVGLTVVDFILFLVAFVMLYRTLKASRQTEKELARLHEESIRHNDQLALKNRQKNTQARLADVLQSVLTPEEAYRAIEKYCEHLFAGHPGMFYMRSNSKDYFELKATWNGGIGDHGFEPNDCWAARNNHIHRFDSQHDDLPCAHVINAGREVAGSICLPISSTDEMIGILTLAGPADGDGKPQPVAPEVEKLAVEVVNQIGLAITNLRLRDSLRRSSIIDALTGLFNRRYLDETLVREFARAERSAQPIGVIMLDIDHFKVFNDTYGHEAGDNVLRVLGPLLKNTCRTSDIACRFGGEEFIVVLPQADLAITSARAEAIRADAKKLRLVYGGTELPAVTVSLGVAVFPAHGVHPDEVIRAADDALYRAKNTGRDRVEVSDTTLPDAKAR